MPKATVEEEETYALPEDTAFPAELVSVTIKTIQYEKKDRFGNKTGERDSFDRWLWEFRITDGEYESVKAFGETDDKVTAGENDRPRSWGGTLRNHPYEFGEDFDTDDLIGLPCIITVIHEEPRPNKKTGGMFYGSLVDQVYPADALPPATGQSSTPPPY